MHTRHADLPTRLLAEPLRQLDLRDSADLMLGYMRERGADLILFVWAAFVFMHAYIFMAGAHDELWYFQLNNERGISEHWEAVMLVASFALLAFRSVQKNRPAYLVPAFIMLYMALDGRLEIHEQVGLALWPAHRSGGELLFMAAAGAVFLLALWAVIRRSSAEQKNELTCYAGLVLLFGMFGAVIDCLHALLKSLSARFDHPMAWIEDGGELLAISLMLIVSLGVFRRLRTA